MTQTDRRRAVPARNLHTAERRCLHLFKLLTLRTLRLPTTNGTPTGATERALRTAATTATGAWATAATRTGAKATRTWCAATGTAGAAPTATTTATATAPITGGCAGARNS